MTNHIFFSHIFFYLWTIAGFFLLINRKSTRKNSYVFLLRSSVPKCCRLILCIYITALCFNFCVKFADVLGAIRSVNKTDVVTLGTSFEVIFVLIVWAEVFFFLEKNLYFIYEHPFDNFYLISVFCSSSMEDCVTIFFFFLFHI